TVITLRARYPRPLLGILSLYVAQEGTDGRPIAPPQIALKLLRHLAALRLQNVLHEAHARRAYPGCSSAQFLRLLHFSPIVNVVQETTAAALLVVVVHAASNRRPYLLSYVIAENVFRDFQIQTVPLLFL
ncbi:unnamed protein product, partial [Litomosoides sigmodontis]